MTDEDEDVVINGSQLHQHLQECGFSENLETMEPSSSSNGSSVHLDQSGLKRYGIDSN